MAPARDHFISTMQGVVMLRKECYPVDRVLPFVIFEPKKIGRFANDQKMDFNGDLIKMASDRYKLFATKGLKCCCCGITGMYFAKERFRQNKVYHFNLYGIDEDGNEVLITKDHIFPKSKGGPDSLENYQVMCYTCNEVKGTAMDIEDNKGVMSA